MTSAPDRDLRPLAVVAAVAFGSITLLALAVALGWLGPDVGRGANFCEAARDCVVRQPANTYSNLGFVLAGLLFAWQAGRPAFLGSMSKTLATVAAVVVVLLGPASAAMHATQSAWGGHLDLLSMYLIAAWAASYGWARWARAGTTAMAVAFVAAVVLCEAAGLWPEPVPVVQFAGNMAFAGLLLTAVAFETALWRREPATRTIGYGLGALGAMVVAFVIWNLGQHGWCDPHSLVQAHAAWHLLCALAAYLLLRLYASETSPVQERPM